RAVKRLGLYYRHFRAPVPLFKRLRGRLIPKNSPCQPRVGKVGLKRATRYAANDRPPQMPQESRYQDRASFNISRGDRRLGLAGVARHPGSSGENPELKTETMDIFFPECLTLGFRKGVCRDGHSAFLFR